MKSMRNVAALALCTSLAFGAVSIGPSIAFAADEMPAKSDQPVTDTWITTKVKAELATTDGIKSGDVSVTTKNGLVTLSGVVNSKAQVQKSIAVTKSVKGVRYVDASALSSRD